MKKYKNNKKFIFKNLMQMKIENLAVGKNIIIIFIIVLAVLIGYLATIGKNIELKSTEYFILKVND